MSGGVIGFPGITTLPVPAERVIDGAQEAKLRRAVVIGVTESGEPYYASSDGSPADTLMMVEKFKKFLIDETL